MKSWLEPIIENITGLNNTSVLVLGSGLVREDYKTLCFRRAKGIHQYAIQNPKQIAQLLVPASQGRILENAARIELLKETFQESSLKEALPTLLAHRFRPKFFENLDRVLQKGRAFFAHQEEAAVLRLRLEERLGRSEKREEFFLLNRLWESVLRSRRLWDEARLFEEASVQIEIAPPAFLMKVKLMKLEHFTDFPRLQYFWSRVSGVVPVESFKPKELNVNHEKVYELTRKQAHSLEDAAHFLIDQLLEGEMKNPGSLQQQAIVIQDAPSIRRTLKRVMESRGLVLNDPRDPTMMVQSELIKLALLEPEMVAKNFPSHLVLIWLSYQRYPSNDCGKFRKYIIEKALVQGIESYQGMPELHLALSELKKKYLRKASLPHLQEQIQECIKKYSLPTWVRQAIEKIFNEWEQSFFQLNSHDEGESKVRTWPLRHLVEQLTDKVKKATPVTTPLKYEAGVKLFRVDQAVSPLLDETQTQIHFFGVGKNFFEPKDEGNDWFSARDLEILSHEFSIPSVRESQAERMQSFLAWCAAAEQSSLFWEFQYDETGSECESIELNLIESQKIALKEKEDLGVHPSVLRSLQSRLKSREPQVRLELARSEWPISFLNAYGNCAFTALAGYGFVLYDERETDFDLKGDSYGNLIHAALEFLVKNKMSSHEAFDAAWEKTAQVAWLKSERLKRAIRNKTILLLERFSQSEAEYQKRSGTQVRELEYEVEWEKQGIRWKGRVDRIDQHEEGVVLIDYKTSAKLPSGRSTFEKNVGLQLPIYALAIQEKIHQNVVTAQYVHLTPQKINRNIGFLFKKWNQAKIASPVNHAISNARSVSQSLFDGTPAEIWEAFDQKISHLILELKNGNFSAIPSDPSECAQCRYLLVCGKKRRSSSIASEDVLAQEEDLS